jgi:GntR family transcriptional regulator
LVYTKYQLAEVTVIPPHRIEQNHKPHPLYLQVQATLKEMIEDVEFGPGDQIPSERELSQQLGVSRMTVRRAIENLIGLGLLERRSTNGTYVREPKIARNVGTDLVQSFSQQLLQRGAEPGSQLISFEIIRAPRKVADYLNLRLGKQVYVIRRLRLANNLPICIETSYLPEDLIPDLRKDDLEGEKSLYELLRDRYHLAVFTSDDIISFSQAMEEEAEFLDLQTGDPVLFMRSVVYDTEERPVEYLKSINHPQRVVFRTNRKF